MFFISIFVVRGCSSRFHPGLLLGRADSRDQDLLVKSFLFSIGELVKLKSEKCHKSVEICFMKVFE